MRHHPPQSKAGKLCYDVKKEIELNKIDFFFLLQTNPLRRSVSYVISDKKVTTEDTFIHGGSTLVKNRRHYNFWLLPRILVINKQ